MTQVQDWNNERLNIALSKLMGRTESTAIAVNYNMIAKYCEDPAASLEVQTAAINVNPSGYVRNLAIVRWADAVDVEDVEYWSGINIEDSADLFVASPRERAEAAYITLHQSVKG